MYGSGLGIAHESDGGAKCDCGVCFVSARGMIEPLFGEEYVERWRANELQRGRIEGRKIGRVSRVGELVPEPCCWAPVVLRDEYAVCNKSSSGSVGAGSRRELSRSVQSPSSISVALGENCLKFRRGADVLHDVREGL
jgi:hypothetical protein